MPKIERGPLALITTSEEDSANSLAEYLESWLWGEQSLRPSTHLSYEIHVRRYFTPYLGSIALEELRPGHIERMYRHLALVENTGGRPLSVSTLRRIHATLISASNTAVKRGLIDRNPAATVELPRVHKTRVETWSAVQLIQFLEAISEDRLHPLYLVLGLVGLRRGEAVALRWSDVDLNAGLLRIEQSAVKVGDRSVVGPPKSSSGVRVVAIDDETARRLHWHRCRQRLGTLKTTGEKLTPELVFHHPERRRPGPGLRVAALRSARRTARPAAHPAARPAAHLGLHRPGIGRDAGGGQPSSGAQLDQHHR